VILFLGCNHAAKPNADGNSVDSDFSELSYLNDFAEAMDEGLDDLESAMKETDDDPDRKPPAPKKRRINWNLFGGSTRNSANKNDDDEDL
jgi:hypothetical protein